MYGQCAWFVSKPLLLLCVLISSHVHVYYFFLPFASNSPSMCQHPMPLYFLTPPSSPAISRSLPPSYLLLASQFILYSFFYIPSSFLLLPSLFLRLYSFSPSHLPLLIFFPSSLLPFFSSLLPIYSFPSSWLCPCCLPAVSLCCLPAASLLRPCCLTALFFPSSNLLCFSFYFLHFYFCFLQYRINIYGWTCRHQ